MIDLLEIVNQILCIFIKISLKNTYFLSILKNLMFKIIKINLTTSVILCYYIGYNIVVN